MDRPLKHTLSVFRPPLSLPVRGGRAGIFFGRSTVCRLSDVTSLALKNFCFGLEPSIPERVMHSEAHSPPQGLVLQDPLLAGFSLSAALPNPGLHAPHVQKRMFCLRLTISGSGYGGMTSIW